MTEADALLAELFALRRFGMMPGLGTMRALYSELGEPGRGLRFIHIAGTNGKGSVAAFLDSVLRAAGYRVGLYTSPHLVDFGERIRVNGMKLSDADLVRHYQQLRPALGRVGKMDGLHIPTFFETTTALALRVFEEQDVGWVVWETGMGGRWDATNIVRPEICVLTSMGLDHAQYLGATLREISEEKAGIIKAGVPCVSAPQRPEVLEVLGCRAHAIGAKWVPVGGETIRLCSVSLGGGQHFTVGGRECQIGLLGGHQRINAAVVLGVCGELTERGWSLPEEVVRHGMAATRWPGRFHVLRKDPMWIVDGAHNPEGAKVLAQTWREVCPAVRPHLIFGVLDDKDALGIAKELVGWIRSATVVRAGNERASSPDRAAAALREAKPSLEISVRSVEEALREAEESGGPVLVAGSLYLAGEILRREAGLFNEE